MLLRFSQYFSSQYQFLSKKNVNQLIKSFLWILLITDGTSKLITDGEATNTRNCYLHDKFLCNNTLFDVRIYSLFLRHPLIFDSNARLIDLIYCGYVLIKYKNRLFQLILMFRSVTGCVLLGQWRDEGMVQNKFASFVKHINAQYTSKYVLGMLIVFLIMKCIQSNTPAKDSVTEKYILLTPAVIYIYIISFGT